MLLIFAFDYNASHRTVSPFGMSVPLEDRTARLTILIDPRKKALFERLCAHEDAAASQVVRRLIRRYIQERTGTLWTPGNLAPPAMRGSAQRSRRL